ncbi:LysM peptidoglycan-binding domain-containing protein [uncultured Dokdonia sp.]|uniref:LysM peptidoglycan-binding domain-containing protein n=1 Tax=uncultured Dokdonia sp. TaxID=575653 RepID=UPI00261A5901|nr:LysM peptidoglycan-binding domain-containing protein [uncultured Dokdonia sp.]
MKLKHLFLVCICVVSFAFAKAESATPAFFQEFISHQVAKGETLYSIARKYKLTEKDIIKLNPDAKERVYEGLVLILPESATASKETATPQEDVRFKTHKVRRKETLYSISKKYNVTQDAIKKYNKRLYSETLRKGDKIRIPLNYVGVVEEKVTITNTGGGISQEEAPKDGGAAFVSYTVKAKETKYGIARLYGITIAELETMNPEMKDGLKVGQTIKVPNTTVEKNDTAVINEEVYAFYEVKKGNTIYSLLKEFNISADKLVELNPTVGDGLKEGMILKVPKGVSGTISNTTADAGTTIEMAANTTKGSLLDSLSDYSTKKVVLMLPFGVNRTTADSLANAEDVIKSDRALRISLDFYSGVLVALDHAKQQGISTDLQVYDTEYVRGDGPATNARKVERLISSNDFSGVDVVIGPLLASNFNRASTLLARQRVPLISPITQRVDFRSNVFQSRPSEAQLREVMIDYLKPRAAGKNIIIIADKKNGKVKTKLQSLFPSAKVVTIREGDNGPYLGQYDVTDKISEFQENWIILETNDVPLISSVTTKLTTLLTTRKVTLFTTYKGTAYDSDAIQHMDLMHLHFHYPSMNKEYTYSATKEFVDTYEDRYDITPSKEAIRGYDIMYDTLLRLAFAENLYDAAKSGIETNYIENKFRYDQKSSGGFYNNAIYLIKYSEGLMLEEVSRENPEEVED